MMAEALQIILHLDSWFATIVESGNTTAIVIFTSIFFAGETAVLASISMARANEIALLAVFFLAVCAFLVADIFWFVVCRYIPTTYIPSALQDKVFSRTGKILHSLTDKELLLFLTSFKFFIGFRLATIVCLARTKISFFRFLLYDIIGTLFYLSVLTLVGGVFGEFVALYMPQHTAIASIGLAIAVVLVINFISRKKFKVITPR